MATGKYQSFSEDLLNWALHGDTITQPTAANVYIAWGTTTPDSTTVPTELSETGYTSGGTAVGFTSAVTGDPTVSSNTSQIQWTNSGGTTWAEITSALIHYGGATYPPNTANCMYFLSGLTITVPAAATLTIAAGDLDVSED